MIVKYCDAIGMDHVSLWNIKDTIGNCSNFADIYDTFKHNSLLF